MTKLLSCRECQDVVMLYPNIWRICQCQKSAGIFLSDNHHALLIGPAIALGLFNQDLAEAFQPNIESGYFPVRTWRIPDGDRIITLSAKTTGVAVTTSCLRCKPCQYPISGSATLSPSGKLLITVEAKREGTVVQTFSKVELLPEG
jgi:hypothetical protein